ncbi:leucine-rich repeat-containing protein 71 isoform X5 [Hydra vulgaris]|uniref:Leucine-rich repeat-containing protein 71 isoform X5 n=1 Tax=Hydra vulgaris TaxID=6087 RepID=A0ABM4B7Q7_HYDVU
MAKKNLDKSGKVPAPAISTTSAQQAPTTQPLSTQEPKIYNKILSSDEKRALFEKYQPNGNFEKDFTELCFLLDLPSVCSTLDSTHFSSKSVAIADISKNREDKKLILPQDVNSSGMISDKNKKLKVDITVEDDGGKKVLKELHVRGWKLDKKFVTILTATIPDLEKINLIDLWNTGLDDHTLNDLAVCLNTLTSLRTLRLDGNNNISNQRFDMFITEKSVLQNLSLRSCHLDDSAAKLISDALLINKSLLTLNLCFNKITDIGGSYIAKALRMNRSLLSLNLASNNISDDGALSLSQSLSTFPLTHEQVVARRMLLSSFSSDDLAVSPSSSISTEHDQSSRSFSKQEDKKKIKKKTPVKDSIKRGSSSIDASKNPKTSKNKSAKTDHLVKTPQPDVEDLYEFKNPLLEKVNSINKELWIPGNRSLIILNLSRNKITDIGLVSLLEAIKYQAAIAQEMNKNVTHGLMRLSLQGNSFDNNHPDYLQLQQLMKTRDPFYVQSTRDSKS